MIDHDEIIRSANELKSIPQSVSRLASLVAQDEPNFDEIVEAVSFDPTLTMRLLRVANSTVGGSRREIATVKDAVIRLGSGSLLCLAMGSVVQDMAQSAIPEFGLLQGGFWRHSVMTALAAQRLKMFCNAPIPPESFTAALLHDFGKLVLCNFLGPEELGLLKRAHEEGGLSYAHAETELFEINHGDVGGVIGRHWQLPESVVQAIIFHHDPGQSSKLICYVVHLANVISNSVQEKTNSDLEIESETWERLEMSPEDMQKISEYVESDCDEVMAMYS